MNISPAFVTDTEPAELVEPAPGALDHPTRFAQAAAVRLADLGQQVLDAEALEKEGMGFAAVSTITLHDVGTPPRAAHFASNPLKGYEHRNKLGAVVDVGTAQREAQRYALGIGEKMMLAARFAEVRRVRPRLSPPKTARTELESATARDQSIWSAAWSRARSSWWRRSHTPACCQSRSLRQQVMPLPQPISKGRSFHPIPVFRTKRIPVRAARLGIGLRPGCRLRRGFSGKSGLMISHNLSSTNAFAISSICPIQNTLYSHFVTRS